MSFLRYVLYVAVLVALCAGIYFVLKSEFADADAQDQSAVCPTFYNASTATFDDFARSSPYFVKYYASSNESTYPAYSSKDGHKVTLTRIGTSDDYAFNMTSVDNSGIKYVTESVYTVDESTHRVKKYGVWQNYQIMSFDEGSYALVYFCIPKEDGYELYRSLMTTSLDNDLTSPLKEDGAHNFTQSLFELPFKYKEQY